MSIELCDIHKHYGPVEANNGITLSVKPGRTHGILGENGAGKSTLMKILSDYSQKTGGMILVDGSPVDFRAPAQASKLGIGMLYQDPLDFPLLSVLDNFVLGQTSGILDQKNYFKKIFEQIADNFNFTLHPDDLEIILVCQEKKRMML